MNEQRVLKEIGQILSSCNISILVLFLNLRYMLNTKREIITKSLSNYTINGEIFLDKFFFLRNADGI